MAGVELSMVILTALSVIVSFTAVCLSYHASQKSQVIATVANEMQVRQLEMQHGQVEMQMREMISIAKSRYQDKAVELANTIESDFAQNVLKAVKEDVSNAYDEACAKYIDNKVDRERFKKMYHDEIRQWVSNEVNKADYIEPHTKFHATNLVYQEWNNLEIR